MLGEERVLKFFPSLTPHPPPPTPHPSHPPPLLPKPNLRSARRALLALQHADRDGRKSQHEKNWRPQLLVLVPTGTSTVADAYLTGTEQLASGVGEPFCVSRNGKRLLEFVSQ